jgi:hypothetical protein
MLDLNDTICPDGQCPAEQGGKVVFRDSEHMTATFARSLGKELGQRLNMESPPDQSGQAR